MVDKWGLKEGITIKTLIMVLQRNHLFEVIYKFNILHKSKKDMRREGFLWKKPLG